MYTGPLPGETWFRFGEPPFEGLLAEGFVGVVMLEDRARNTETPSCSAQTALS
jgi:hypothetical protein